MKISNWIDTAECFLPPMFPFAPYPRAHEFEHVLTGTSSPPFSLMGLFHPCDSSQSPWLFNRSRGDGYRSPHVRKFTPVVTVLVTEEPRPALQCPAGRMVREVLHRKNRLPSPLFIFRITSISLFIFRWTFRNKMVWSLTRLTVCYPVCRSFPLPNFPFRVSRFFSTLAKLPLF